MLLYLGGLEFLKEAGISNVGAFFSHDREFIELVCDRTIELKKS